MEITKLDINKAHLPKTLWEACEMACESIEARPWNYCQGSWAAEVPWVLKRFGVAEHPTEEEVCGTAYCRAGWIAASIKGQAVSSETMDIGGYVQNLMHDAGIPYAETNALFDGHAVGPNERMGTPEYVKRGVDGLRAFMNRWEGQLKAAKINEP